MISTNQMWLFIGNSYSRRRSSFSFQGEKSEQQRIRFLGYTSKRIFLEILVRYGPLLILKTDLMSGLLLDIQKQEPYCANVIQYAFLAELFSRLIRLECCWLKSQRLFESLWEGDFARPQPSSEFGTAICAEKKRKLISSFFVIKE